MMQDVHMKFIPGLPRHKAALNIKKTILTSKLGINLRNRLMECYIGGIALYGVETWTLQKVDWKYLASSEMSCWRRMEKIIGLMV